MVRIWIIVLIQTGLLNIIAIITCAWAVRIIAQAKNIAPMALALTRMFLVEWILL
jgi:hypothetical protein